MKSRLKPKAIVPFSPQTTEEPPEETRRPDAEAERQRQQEAEAERQRQEEAQAQREREEAEAERQRQEEVEAERKRQEAERQRQEEAQAQREREEAEAERQHQEEEAERKRKDAEAERKRQEEAQAERRRQEEAAAERRRQDAAAERQRQEEAERERLAERARLDQLEAEQERQETRPEQGQQTDAQLDQDVEATEPQETSADDDEPKRRVGGRRGNAAHQELLQSMLDATETRYEKFSIRLPDHVKKRMVARWNHERKSIRRRGLGSLGENHLIDAALRQGRRLRITEAVRVAKQRKLRSGGGEIPSHSTSVHPETKLLMFDLEGDLRAESRHGLFGHVLAELVEQFLDRLEREDPLPQRVMAE
ncbi:hypothetical protein ACQEVF_57630 [Nonomuraea polychroma]|uniref:hypothetical protein n=1 Tax=Nonomuraea polychroma TaxID=46176 RepID=UPI003D8D12B1